MKSIQSILIIFSTALLIIGCQEIPENAHGIIVSNKYDAVKKKDAGQLMAQTEVYLNHLNAGDTLLSQAKYLEAIDQFQKADTMAFLVTDRARTHRRIAECYEKIGEAVKAIEYYKLAIGFTKNPEQIKEWQSRIDSILAIS